MSNDTITIDISDSVWNDINMNSSSADATYSGITLTGTAGVHVISISDSDTISFSGLDEYVHVTKTEHTELVDRVAKLEAMLAEEAELRANHPALKQAYDEYRLLLVLTKQHTPAILTDE
jgi:hypothetical protein